ncbi:FUN14 domain-containing protein [Deinococcus sp. HMF7604]|uniref:FUN14 domain-containing protein n=1 Tax=Deinococcus TaxID=1298 RepID=UPI001CCAED8E|nr:MULTISPECIES: FUN14 domain-containing protein [Deinococcus]MBZ9752927.1 FUN14 domain-containing protein [Deinococcus betulae]
MTRTVQTLVAAPPPEATLADALRPLLPDLSVGALLGFATGVALRHIGRAALIVLGTLVLVLQLLAYFDLISVNWLRVQALTEPWLRQGQEQGGAWLMRVLTANLPFAGAFTGGLLLGLRARV